MDVREERDSYKADIEDVCGEINALAEEGERLQDRLAAAPGHGEVEAAIENLEAACEDGDRTGVDVALDRVQKATRINGDIER